MLGGSKGLKFSQILTVSLCDCAGTIHTDKITVMWSNLNDYSSVGPLARIVACLLLNCNMITSFKGWKCLTSTGKLLCFLDMSFGIGFGSRFSCLSPFLSWLELAWLKWEEIT